jgi:hypothetical protein
MCCDVAVWQADHSQPVSTDIYPLQAYGIRNDKYKLVVNNFQNYDPTSNSCLATTSTEFYRINENVPVPKLDRTNADLLANGAKLNKQEQKNYDALTAQFKTLLASQPACSADINLDGIVNLADIGQWTMFADLSLGLSSWADVNLDGLTDQSDLTAILQNFGACPT